MEGRKRPILAYQELSAEAIGWPRFNFTSLNRAVLRSPTSALKRIADSSQTLRHVRNVPTQTRPILSSLREKIMPQRSSLTSFLRPHIVGERCG